MKILLVGWEGVEAPALRSLRKAGRLGSVGRLAAGRLLDVTGLGRTTDASTAWTSLTTGKRPTKHRVLSGLEIAPREAGLRAIRRSNRHAQAIWEIVQQAGRAAHAVNWPASHPPAGSGAGVVVSDHFFAPDADGNSVFPADEFEELKPLRVGSEEVDARTLAPLLPSRAPAALVAAMRTFVAAAASVQAVATTLLEHRPAEMMAVRFPALPDALGSNAETLARTMEFLDLMLGRLAKLGGSECCIVLACMASHGAVIAAANADANARAVSVFDLAPTLLAKLGIAAGADMDGRASDRFLGPVQVLEPRLSWEPASADAPNDTDGESAVAHLLALGYREQPDRYAQHAIDQHRRQERVRLALAYLDSQEPQPATELLEPIAETTGPFSQMVRSTLAEAYFFANRMRDCRELVQRLIAEGADTALARLALAALDARERRPADAREHLRLAEQRGSGDPFVLRTMGQIYLQLGEEAAAEKVLLRALALDPQSAGARVGLARLALRRGEDTLALQHASAAAERRPEEFAAQFVRGTALLRLGRAAEAVTVLQRAAALNRRRSAAVLRRLAEAMEQAGDFAGAQQQRFLAQQQRHRAAGIIR